MFLPTLIILIVRYIISDGCLLGEGFRQGKINVAKCLEKGMVDPVTFATKSEPKDLFELVRKEDIDDYIISPHANAKICWE